MLVPRQKLEKYITEQCMSIAMNKDKLNTIYDSLLEEFNMPASVSFDIVTLKSDCSHVSEYVLFCLLYVIDKGSVNKYFTNDEISYYSEAKYEFSSIKFPLKFKVSQISYDQWVGGLNAIEFAEMHEAKLINYDPNTQRSLKKIVRGETVHFAIDINQAAVKSIKKSLSSGTYIPDPLTLNIPLEDEEADFNYKDGVLTIHKLKHFNIIDGYHRLVAIDQLHNEDKNFDYPMEIRIANFAEDKAQQFIFQQDQKTQMKKLDSDSLNKNDIANDIVKRLNEDSGCDLYGLIGRNDSYVSFPEMSVAIRYFFKYKSSMGSERTFAIKTAKLIKEGINSIISEEPELMERKWNSKEIFLVITSVYDSIEGQQNVCDIYQKYKEILDTVDIQDCNRSFFNKNFRKLYKTLKER